MCDRALHPAQAVLRELAGEVPKSFIRRAKRCGFYTVVTVTISSGYWRASFLEYVSQTNALCFWDYEARLRWVTGRGSVLLNVHPQTGYVTSARMLQTMGHKILDDAGVETFRRWRFKPGRVDKVRVPIAFMMRGAPTGEPGALAIYAPRRQYPYEARARRLTGRGLVLFRRESANGVCHIRANAANNETQNS
jgi:TonB family protein